MKTVLHWRLREPDQGVGQGKVEGGCGQGYEWFALKTPSYAMDSSKWR